MRIKFKMPPTRVMTISIKLLRLHNQRASIARNFSYSNSKSVDPYSSPSTTLIKTATSILSNLHLKIASTLTSSLQPKDRERLLQNLNIKFSNKEQYELLEKHCKENDDQGRINNTIGQAVAAAVANDAAKNKSLTDQEREEIWKKAEHATLERVKHEILLKDRQLISGTTTTTTSSSDGDGDISINETIATKAVSNDAPHKVHDHDHDQHDQIHHPILGPTLVDLGYKRIHLASAQTLSAIPIWERQRIYRHDRAKVMAQDKLKSMDLGLPGVISLHESVEGNLSILDGQHRVGMLTILQEKLEKEDADTNLNLKQILVEVFPQSSAAQDSHAQDIFTEINKAEPVKLVDMPGVAKVGERRIINEASSLLQEAYPEMFKPSQRCRSPHLNVDNLRDAIFAAGIITRHNLKSHRALVSWILQQNEELGKKYQDDKNCPSNISATALKKAKQYGFYLGLDSAWLYK
jgi:hypothetical protein